MNDVYGYSIVTKRHQRHRKSLRKHNSVSTHHKNIKALAIEMFKVKHKLCPERTGDIFMERANNQ